MFFFFMLFACATFKQSDDSDLPVEPEEPQDTGPSLEAFEHHAACLPGLIIEYDLGTEDPYSLTLELRYAFNVWIEIDASRYGQILKFQCGDRDDATYGEPKIDGEWVGPIIGWRATWLELVPLEP